MGSLTSREPWRLTEEIALVTEYNKRRRAARTQSNEIRRVIPPSMWAAISEGIETTTGSRRTPKAVKSRAFIISSRVNHCTKSANPFDVKAVAASFLREIDRDTQIETERQPKEQPETTPESKQLILGLPTRTPIEGIWTPLDLANLKIYDLQPGEKYVAETSQSTVGGQILFRVFIERVTERKESER